MRKTAKSDNLRSMCSTINLFGTKSGIDYQLVTMQNKMCALL
jgi:hypothetical protein